MNLSREGRRLVRPVIGRMLAVVLITASGASHLMSATFNPAMPPREWWYSAKDDATWTNKSPTDLRVAAERRDAVAQYYLSRAFFVGETGHRDMAEAYRWIRLSAEQGYPQAELLLARFCYWGLETERSETQGFAWASRAAAHGNADAMTLVGIAHVYGEGTPRNASKGLDWYHRALNTGSRLAPRWLGDYYFNGEAGTATRTNYVEALRWFEVAASNGLASAALKVMEMYDKGLGTPPKPEPVLHWARRFADQGNPDMLERLSSIYSQGLAEPRAPDDSPTELLRRAAIVRAMDALERGPATWELIPSWGLIHDCQPLWNRYRFGTGTPRDYIAAAQWMWQARQEDLRRVAAGQRSLTGTNPPAHPFDTYLKAATPPWNEDERRWRQAVQLVHDALDLRKPEAWHQIGEHYRDGSALTPQDRVPAWAWFARAMEMGHAPARNALHEVESQLTAQELAQAKRFWIPPMSPNR